MMDDDSETPEQQPEDVFEGPIAPLTPRSRPGLVMAMAAAIGMVSLLAQAAAIVSYMAVADASDPTFNAAKWAENAGSNGLALSIATWACGVGAMPPLFFFAGRLSGGRALEFLGWRAVSLKSVAGWVLALLLFLVGYDALSWWMEREVASTFMRDVYLTAGHPALLWLTVVVAAPVVEEFMFRGFLFAGLVRSPLGVAGTALATSLMWAMLHLHYDATAITMIFVVGLLLTAARQVTGSIIPCLAMHAAMNAMATLELYYGLQMEAGG
jgi:membrane protease YdiL (CAAX protease family)